MVFIIGQMNRVVANGPGDQGSIPGRVIPKIQKVVLDAVLFSTQHYKVRIKGILEQSWEWSSARLHLGVVAIEKGAFRSPLTKVAEFTYMYILHMCMYVCTFAWVFIIIIIMSRRLRGYP